MIIEINGRDRESTYEGADKHALELTLNFGNFGG